MNIHHRREEGYKPCDLVLQFLNKTLDMNKKILTSQQKDMDMYI